MFKIPLFLLNSTVAIHRGSKALRDKAGAIMPSYNDPIPAESAVRCRFIEIDGKDIEGKYQKEGNEIFAKAIFRGVIDIGVSDMIVWRGRKYVPIDPCRDVHGLGNHTEIMLVARVG